MPDDKTIVSPSDKKRIDINDPDEIRNWCKSFNCTPKKLKVAAKKSGSTSADVVKGYL